MIKHEKGRTFSEPPYCIVNNHCIRVKEKKGQENVFFSAVSVIHLLKIASSILDTVIICKSLNLNRYSLHGIHKRSVSNGNFQFALWIKIINYFSNFAVEPGRNLNQFTSHTLLVPIVFS